MTRSFQLRLLVASALVTGCLFVSPGLRAGDEVGVPKDGPAFKVTMPDGWEAKDAITGISPELANGKGLVVHFKKLSGADEKAVMAATEKVAKERVEYDKEIKTDEAIAALPDPVAGNKAYQVTMSSVSMPPDRYMYHVISFSVDGKTYYAAPFQGAEVVVKASSEDIAAILAAITPAK